MLKDTINYYLNSIKSKEFFYDSDKIYSSDDFKILVNYYITEFKKIWTIKKTNKGVAILLDRKIDYLAAIFASWLSDGYYLPLSKETPKDMIDYQIKSSGVTILIKNKNNKVIIKKLKKKYDKKFKSAAYIIFTSGSTGKKKGVLITKKNFLEYIKNLKKNAYSIKPKSCLISGEITFDIVNADLAFILLNKSKIGITDDTKNTFSLINMLETNNFDSLYCVPSTWKNLIYFAEQFKKKMHQLRFIYSGGELLDVKLYEKMKKIAPNAKIYNFYGPTEFTINSSFCEITKMKIKTREIIDQNENISIGKIFKDLDYKIIKQDEFSGELYLAGNQRMYGYINSNKQPFRIIKNKKFYPTGDIVSQNKKGYIFFIGRKKDYIKYKGYRINLQEISNIISKTIERNCLVEIYDKKIQLFIEGKKIKQKTFDNKIAGKLEYYEKPSKIIYINEFPSLANGKIDKKKLVSTYA